MRLIIFKTLLRLDNLLRRWITYYSLENGVHPKHRLTGYHQFFIDNVSSHDTALDIGCGHGFLAYDVSTKAKHVTGIDINQDYIATAQRLHRRPNLKFILGDATTCKFTVTFDAIILSNVLEHINDRVSLLKKIRPLSNKLLIRVPMIDRDWLPLRKKELGVEYRLDTTHQIEYTENIFRQELAAAGLKISQLNVRFGEIYCVASPTSKRP